MRTAKTIRAILALLCLTAAVPGRPLAGGEAPATVPPELAVVLDTAREALASGEPGRAVRALSAYDGEDHALRHLLLGHARLRADELDAAAGSYRRALEMDEELNEARKGLAQVYVRQQRWDRAASVLGRFVGRGESDAEWLALYARVAVELRDWRLCRLLVDDGIVRFPDDLRFRRLDLSLLIREGRAARAAQVALRLLSWDAADPELWKQLADIRAQEGQDGGRRAALEAALLCQPDDLQRHERFLLSELAAGNWLATLRHGQALLGGPLAKQAREDTGIMELLIRAADMGERDELLQQWLALVPAGERTRAVRVARARMSLRRGRPETARKVLRELIELGEADAGVFLWAGRLAERAGDYPEAEAYYEQARSAGGSSGRLAVLYLARLHFERARYRRAAQLLRGYLNDRPEDAPTRALLAVVEEAIDEDEAAAGDQ